MQFNVVPRTGGLAINREKLRKKEGCDGIILTDARWRYILTSLFVPVSSATANLMLEIRAITMPCYHDLIDAHTWTRSPFYSTLVYHVQSVFYVFFVSIVPATQYIHGLLSCINTT